jgi:hypothetical protein
MRDNANSKEILINKVGSSAARHAQVQVQVQAVCVCVAGLCQSCPQFLTGPACVLA